ncbi:hypothetical protein P4H39_01950 [Paenibacillus lautus]|uniref:hypothetical protein n=1 Tax=Paenibacillus lautus TaxID=1401 RepID=UPI002DBE5606|nr:hypothetical protein [Paenibacillus lautus]MEC0201388.1 hypothetical protein [Paenibacillus lautus]
MNQLWSRWKGPILGSALLLSLTACLNQTDDNQQNTQSMDQRNADAVHLHSTDVIPSYHGPKTETTNVHGNTTSGMGMSVYSMIGSSSLHEGGVSSHVQSRLAGLGIDGVKAFVLNDTIVLARAESQVSSNHYDNMQQKVLSQTEGMSGKGEPDEGVSGAKIADNDNMSQAKEQVKSMFNEEVQILTVTNPQAPALIDRIASKLHDAPRDESIARDISELLRMASDKK